MAEYKRISTSDAEDAKGTDGKTRSPNESTRVEEVHEGKAGRNSGAHDSVRVRIRPSSRNLARNGTEPRTPLSLGGYFGFPFDVAILIGTITNLLDVSLSGVSGQSGMDFSFLLVSVVILGVLFWIALRNANNTTVYYRMGLHYALCLFLGLACSTRIPYDGPGWWVAYLCWLLSLFTCTYETVRMMTPSLIACSSQARRSLAVLPSRLHTLRMMIKSLSTEKKTEEKKEPPRSQRATIREESSIYDSMFGPNMVVRLSAPLQGIREMMKNKTPQEITHGNSKKFSGLWNEWMAATLVDQDQLVITGLMEASVAHKILTTVYERTLFHLRDNPRSPLKLFGCYCETLINFLARTFQDRDRVKLNTAVTAVLGESLKSKSSVESSVARPGMTLKGKDTNRTYSVMGEVKKKSDGSRILIMRELDIKQATPNASPKLLMAKLEKKSLLSATEVQVTSALMKSSHTNVIDLRDICFLGDHRLLIMEEAFKNLREYANLDLSVKRGEARRAIVHRVIVGIFAGIAHLHKSSIFHLDIKPECILIKDDVPKISDFGTSTFETEVVPFFLNKRMRFRSLWEAPEIVCAFKRPAKSEKIDIYSAGITVAFLSIDTHENETWKSMVGVMKTSKEKKSHRENIGGSSEIDEKDAPETKSQSVREPENQNHIWNEDSSLSKAFIQCTCIEPEQRASAQDVLKMLDIDSRTTWY